ncbi:Putative Low temperature requirement A [Septoria linicola]|uniref:Low temperature requirement A n=1 Tax=Septoria linicola TaxID=215465 RepID=A0A9Q9AT68_9PEZI|nr:Putative Low temperature requirement A [Septoria linicola]
MIYLGMYWGLRVVNAEGDNHTYYVWYALAVVETLVVTGVSMKYRDLSIEGTHLVERMSLLTLIVLGEGAIAVAKACQYIAYADGAFTFAGSVAGEIVCATMILYFLYMIYFDFRNEEFFGTIRTQVWSFLHFPLHLALVLAVEGIAQCVTWNAAVRRSQELNNQVVHWIGVLNTTTAGAREWSDAANDLNTTAVELISRQLARSSSFMSTSQGIGCLGQTQISAIPAISNGVEDVDTASNAFWWLTGVLYNTIFKIAGFYPPESNTQREQALDYATNPINFTTYPFEYWQNGTIANVNKSWEVFKITYQYFFVSIGLAIILLAALAWLNRGSQVRLLWPRLLYTTIIGSALALLATMVLNVDHVVNFVLGPWILPTVALCLFGIVIANSVKLPGRSSWSESQTQRW